MAAPDLVAIEKGNKEATFTALATEFKFDDKVKALFLAGSMENLEDFRYYFSAETEIDAFVATDSTLQGPDQRIQISRVRRAWAAVRQNGTRKENRNTVSSVAELDDLLEEGTLREVKVQFWKRYKLKYPTEVSPSDQLLSRCYREMDKRLLTVYDIWKVKTLLHQVMSTKKRKQVGTDLYTFEDEPELTSDTHGVEKYLAVLHTYLLALSIAGSSKVQGAPTDETFGSDSTKFVKVPWDVMQAYLFRASRSVMLLPEASRLSWLEGRDVAERAAWVSQFREGDEPLGQVVQSIMEKRGAHWDTPIQNIVMRPLPAPAMPPGGNPNAGQSPKKQNQGQQKGGGKSKKDQRPAFPPQQPSGSNKPGATAATLRDGTALCADFNNGKCNTRAQSCPKGVHKCSKVLRNGRPCGMSYHGAKGCRNP